MTSQQKKWLVLVCLLIAAGIGGTSIYLQQTDAPMTDLRELNAPVNSIYYTMPEDEHIARDDSRDITFIDNELLITAEESVSEEALSRYLTTWEGRVVGYIQDLHLYQIRFDSTYSYQGLQDLGEELEHSPMIRQCRKNLVGSVNSDGLARNSGDKDTENNTAGWALEIIGMYQAWNSVDLMENPVSVGIFDTGFYELHEALSFASPPLANQVENGEGEIDAHGTIVAGIIGADWNQDTGVSGILPDTIGELYGVSAWGLSGADGSLDLMAFQISIAYLITVKQCRVINLSISPYSVEEEWKASRGNSILCREYQEVLSELFSGLLSTGHDFLICKAAGNEPDLDPVYDPIAALQDEDLKNRILIVEAVEFTDDQTLRLADYSSSGKRSDLSAPGGSLELPILSTSVAESSVGLNESSYTEAAGTSLSAAYVTGTAALLYSINPYLDGEQVADILTETAGEIPENACAPLLDADAAVTKVISCQKGQERATVPYPD